MEEVATRQTVFSATIATLHGECKLLATNKGVCWLGTPGNPIEKGLSWLKRKNKQQLSVAKYANNIAGMAVCQLKEYFSGKRTGFKIPLDLYGTPFQKSVWQELFRIPYGETRSYKEIAKAINIPKATRAVGSSCKNNPVAIIIPCHRVVGSSGGLTGYAGGLAAKKWLLTLEKQA